MPRCKRCNLLYMPRNPAARSALPIAAFCVSSGTSGSACRALSRWNELQSPNRPLSNNPQPTFSTIFPKF
jgi:hypothetical protein